MHWQWAVEFALCVVIWFLGFRTGRTWDRIDGKNSRLR